MSSFIPSIVTAAMLLILATACPAQQTGALGSPKDQTLPSEVREISNLKVSQRQDGRWFANFDVIQNDVKIVAEVQVAAFSGTAPDQSDAPFKNGNNIPSKYVVAQIDATANHVELELGFPVWVKNPSDRGIVTSSWESGTTTDRVVARLVRRNRSNEYDVLARQVVEQNISWPPLAIWEADKKIGQEGSQATLNQAIEQIDYGSKDSIYVAKRTLERLLAKDDKLVQAYVEMARVALAMPGGTEGMLQAEALLNTATKIDPSHVNTHILRGHVYALQGRFALADSDFSKAAITNPKNIWLWSNWGNSLAMQEKFNAAIKMYQKAIESPVSNESYDRARVAAYDQLVVLYQKQHDIQALNDVQQRRLQDYGVKTCYAADFALFKLKNYADADGAIELTLPIANVPCGQSNPKEVLGMAYYVKWSHMKDGDRDATLQKARMNFPSGARLFYFLGGSEKTIDAAKQLTKAGELIDQNDNQKMTALAYAVQTKDTSTARRLLQLGALPTATVGYDAIPVALLPVFTNDLASIALMKKFGVDYATLRYRGSSAQKYARDSGNKKLIEALGLKTPKI